MTNTETLNNITKKLTIFSYNASEKEIKIKYDNMSTTQKYKSSS